MINQLAIFLENKKGRMYDCCSVLKRENINLLSMMVADTKDFGILRLTTSDNDRAKKALKEAGFLVSTNELIGIEMPDRIGALAEVLSELDNADINIEYMYSAVRSDNSAFIILKTGDIDKTVTVLNKLEVKYI